MTSLAMDSFNAWSAVADLDFADFFDDFADFFDDLVGDLVDADCVSDFFVDGIAEEIAVGWMGTGSDALKEQEF